MIRTSLPVSWEKDTGGMHMALGAQEVLQHFWAALSGTLSAQQTSKSTSKSSEPRTLGAATVETAQEALAKARKLGQSVFVGEDRSGRLAGHPCTLTFVIRWESVKVKSPHRKTRYLSRYYISLDPKRTDPQAVFVWNRQNSLQVYTYLEALHLLMPYERLAVSKKQNPVQQEPNIYKLIAHQDQLEAWAEDHYSSQWFSLLSQREKDALIDYSDTAFAWINSALRKSDGTTKLSPDVAEMVQLLDSAISKGCFKRACTVYRGVAEGELVERFGTLQPGMEWVEKSYVSTTLDRNIAHLFCDLSKRGVLMIIRLKAGQRCAYLERLTEHRGELEVLLPRGTKFRVRKRTLENGRRCLYVDAVSD